MAAYGKLEQDLTELLSKGWDTENVNIPELAFRKIENLYRWIKHIYSGGHWEAANYLVYLAMTSTVTVPVEVPVWGGKNAMDSLMWMQFRPEHITHYTTLIQPIYGYNDGSMTLFPLLFSLFVIVVWVNGEDKVCTTQDLIRRFQSVSRVSLDQVVKDIEAYISNQPTFMDIRKSFQLKKQELETMRQMELRAFQEQLKNVRETSELNKVGRYAPYELKEEHEVVFAGPSLEVLLSLNRFLFSEPNFRIAKLLVMEWFKYPSFLPYLLHPTVLECILYTLWLSEIKVLDQEQGEPDEGRREGRQWETIRHIVTLFVPNHPDFEHTLSFETLRVHIQRQPGTTWGDRLRETLAGVLAPAIQYKHSKLHAKLFGSATSINWTNPSQNYDPLPDHDWNLGASQPMMEEDNDEDEVPPDEKYSHIKLEVLVDKVDNVLFKCLNEPSISPQAIQAALECEIEEGIQALVGHEDPLSLRVILPSMSEML
jgi:hypothetical protein